MKEKLNGTIIFINLGPTVTSTSLRDGLVGKIDLFQMNYML